MTGPKRSNRANALRSTGPQTPEGKAASARNALEHGILSKAVIPPALESYESREEYDALLASFVESLAPEGAVEEMLVERVASSYWRLGRYLRAEAAAMAIRRSSWDAPTYDWYNKNRRMAQALQENLAKLDDDDPEAWQTLRDMFDEEYDRHPDDDEMRSAIAQWLPDFDYELPDAFLRGEQAGQAACSLPQARDLPLLMRYEAALDRQIHRALDALERLQRLRRGEFVPPAVRVVVEG
jgi:hypothetical protein